jgi:hypothetical protein
MAGNRTPVARLLKIKEGLAMRVKSVVLATLLLVAPATVSAQNWVIQGAEQFFRIESTTTEGRRGPVVSGYIYSTWGYIAGNVRLIVEGLDAGGQVTSTTLVWVLGTVPNGGRAYFEAAAPRDAASVRVRVGSFEPVARGGQ